MLIFEFTISFFRIEKTTSRNNNYIIEEYYYFQTLIYNSEIIYKLYLLNPNETNI